MNFQPLALLCFPLLLAASVFGAAPTISFILPAEGSTDGGQTVLIGGKNLGAFGLAKFGSSTVPALMVQENIDGNGTSIMGCQTPAHAAGTVNVTLTVNFQSVTAADAFTFIAPPPDPPTISSIIPSKGATAGGQTVIITGTNFVGGMSVKFGGIDTDQLTTIVLSETQLGCQTPAHAAGFVDVVLTTGKGAATATGGYEYSDEASANNPPIIAVDPSATPNPANTNDPVSFDVTAFDFDSGDTLSYAWEFGDSISGNGRSPTHSYASTGTFIASVTVSDGRGGEVTGSVSVTITSAQLNHPPAVTTPASATPNTAYVGEVIAFSVAASDQDGDSLTYSWNFGDATTASGASVNHAYAAAGGYSAGVTVSDGKGGTVSSTVSVLIGEQPVNHLPTVTETAANPNPATVGEPVAFAVAASDPDNDTLAYAWNFGDGSNGSGVSTSHTYAVPGTFNVTVVVTDGRGGSANGSVTVIVGTVNHAPIIASGPTATPSSAFEGQALSFAVAAADQDADPLTYSWNFGDSSSATGISVSHAYAAAGTYNVVVTITDGNNGTATGTVSVEVKAVNEMTVTKLTGKANFTTIGKDSVTATGALPGFTNGFTPAGKVVDVDIGGVTAHFTLDAKGAAKSANPAGTLKMKLKKLKTGGFAGGPVPLQISLKGAFAQTWIDNGILHPNENHKGTPFTMEVLVIYAGTAYAATYNGLLTQLANKAASFK